MASEFRSREPRSARLSPPRRSSLFALALAGVALVPATIASAAITAVELKPAFSATNSSNKSATATCPAGKRVVAAGGQFSFDESAPADGQVSFGVIRPDPTLTSVIVQGREDETGTPFAWQVRADAICAPAPPGLERIGAASPSNSSNKGVVASCPAGKRLLGFGAEVDGGGGEVTPSGIVPGSGLKSVTVTAQEDEGGTAANWRVRAYAICSAPVAGLERIVATSATDSQGKSLQQPCPVGKQLLSAGGEIAGAGGEAFHAQLMANVDSAPNQIFPNSALVAAAEDEDGTSANWTLRAFAVCAAKAVRVVSQTDGFFGLPTAQAHCPAGLQATGLGGDLTGGNGEVLITSLAPLGGSSGSVVEVAEYQFGGSTAWFPRAYAICATPLPGLVTVSTRADADSVSPKSASVSCPLGKRVVGAGGTAIGAGRDLSLGAVLADPALTSVTVTGFENRFGAVQDWETWAYAICAAAPPGLELVSATTEPDSDAAGIAANCPSGKILLGSGASVASGGGRVFLDDVRPNAGLTATAATAFEDEFTHPETWTLTAQAICANP